MSVELHLPDLPEVSLSVGQDEQRTERRRRHRQGRLRDALFNYLPLLVMLGLVLVSWWLVKRSPRAPVEAAAKAVRTTPDYTMQGFAVERFDGKGRLKARIEGKELRHFPDTDKIEIEDVRIQSYAANGQLTIAQARRALTNGAASSLQLSGQAEVTGALPTGRPVRIRSETLLINVDSERVQTDSAVLVEYGLHKVQAEGLDYQHATQLLQLKGRMRAVLMPKGMP
jgi:lipopolysaccharide export system protein LptC